MLVCVYVDHMHAGARGPGASYPQEVELQDAVRLHEVLGLNQSSTPPHTFVDFKDSSVAQAGFHPVILLPQLLEC